MDNHKSDKNKIKRVWCCPQKRNVFFRDGIFLKFKILVTGLSNLFHFVNSFNEHLFEDEEMVTFPFKISLLNVVSDFSY